MRCVDWLGCAAAQTTKKTPALTSTANRPIKIGTFQRSVTVKLYQTADNRLRSLCSLTRAPIGEAHFWLKPQLSDLPSHFVFAPHEQFGGLFDEIASREVALNSSMSDQGRSSFRFFTRSSV